MSHSEAMYDAGRGRGYNDGYVQHVDEVMRHLDTYGAPPGDTIEDRLRAWEQRERALRAFASDVVTWGGGGEPVLLVKRAREALDP